MALLATVLACIAAACGPATAQGAPSRSPSQFSISYERSGGLAAMPQKLVIRPGRHAVLTTRGPAPGGLRTSRFRVAPERIEGLRGALQRADFGSVDTPKPSNCADCYLYGLRYEGHEVSFSEVDVPERLRGVLDRLEEMIAAHLPRH